MSNIKPAMFRGNLPVSVIDHSGRYWLTAEDVGRCLGFADGRERKSIFLIFNRHVDEFSGMDSTVLNLRTVDKKQRDIRVFSMTGCVKLGFFAGTKQAKAFRTWAAKVLASPVSSSSEVVATLQAEYLRTNPEMRRIIEYYSKGLTQAEIGRLLGVSSTTARDRLKTLSRLGLVDYQPNPASIRHGQLGMAARKEKRLFEARQLNLEV